MAKKETIEKLNDPNDRAVPVAIDASLAERLADIRAAVDPRGVNAGALLKLIELIEASEG